MSRIKIPFHSAFHIVNIDFLHIVKLILNCPYGYTWSVWVRLVRMGTLGPYGYAIENPDTLSIGSKYEWQRFMFDLCIMTHLTERG